MKIRKLHLENIGVFEDETIEFKECPGKDKAEIHILTGENGSGKTTILQALANVFVEYLDENRKAIENLRKRFRRVVYNPASSEDFQSQIIVKFDDYSIHIVQGFYRISNGETIFGDDQPAFVNSSLAEFYTYRRSTAEFRYSLKFVPFAYSGYRRIKDEPIEIARENNENPLFQALSFVKDEDSKFNVNQWLGQNLLNNSLAQTKKKLDEAKIFDEKIKRFEKVINDIIADETKDNEIRFEMQSARKLVLIKNEQELDFDVLPDGLKSLISWIGDLLMRLDSLNWKDDTPIFDREIILFLDEIEVHLHPAWQRKVLPIVQKLFKNAQIFVSTHSPFVVNSVDDAWVYKLKVKDGKATVESVTKSEDGNSYSYVLEETFDIKEEFGVEAEKELDEFYELRNSILSNGSSEKDIKKITKLAKDIAKQSEELNTIVQIEIRQINRKKGLNLKV